MSYVPQLMGSKVHSLPPLGMAQRKSEESEDLIPAYHFTEEETEAQRGKASFMM